MNTTKLASAALLALSLSTAAQAVHLDPGGRGQVLIYPYYTVNRGQETYLSVTNTASVAQAAKLRFREGRNGRSVLELDLFLSPFDSWTGTIFALRAIGVDSDGAALLSSDTSCTVPRLSDDLTSFNGLPYMAFRKSGFQMQDGGPFTVDRTREGFVEIIAMADLAAPLAGYIAHGSTGSPPSGCALLSDLHAGNAALSTPTGGLMGSASIIDVARGTVISARAEALGAFTGVPLFVYFDSGRPHLGDVNDGAGPLREKATAKVRDANNRLQTLTFPGPDLRSRKIDAVSAVLMADRVYNDFQTSSALAAASDWILTFPTKWNYTDKLLSDVFFPVLPPFTAVYNGENGSPVLFGSAGYSRDGVLQQSPCNSPLVCPPPAAETPLRYATSVLTLDRLQPAPSVVDSRLVTRRPVYFDAGSMVLNLAEGRESPDTPIERHALMRSAEGKVLLGLPVIGFWASNIVNNNVSNGVLANYAAAVRHSTSVTCVKFGTSTPCD